MKDIEQIAALAAKALFDRTGDPRRSITHPVRPVAFAKAGPLGAGAQLFARCIHVAS